MLIITYYYITNYPKTVYYYTQFIITAVYFYKHLIVSLSQESRSGLAGTSGSKALKSSQIVDQGYSHLQA